MNAADKLIKDQATTIKSLEMKVLFLELLRQIQEETIEIMKISRALIKLNQQIDNRRAQEALGSLEKNQSLN